MLYLGDFDSFTDAFREVFKFMKDSVFKNSFGVYKSGRRLCPNCETFVHLSSFDEGVIVSPPKMAKNSSNELRNIQMDLDSTLSEYYDGSYQCITCLQLVDLDCVYDGGEFMFYEVGEQYFSRFDGEVMLNETKVEIPFVLRVRDTLGQQDRATFSLQSIVFNTINHVTAMNLYKHSEQQHMCVLYDDEKNPQVSYVDSTQYCMALAHVAIVLYKKESRASSSTSSSSSSLLSSSFSSSTATLSLLELAEQATFDDIYSPHECCYEDKNGRGCSRSPMLQEIYARSYCCSQGHYTCETCSDVTVEDNLRQKTNKVCSKCSCLLERSLNRNNQSTYDLVEDARPSTDFQEKIHSFEYDNDNLVFSLFTEIVRTPLNDRLDASLIPLVNTRRGKQNKLVDDLKYYEIFRSIFQARMLPSRNQVENLAQRLMATTTKLLSVKIKETPSIQEQYWNPEPYGFCSILSAEFMGEYSTTGKWPAPLNTKDRSVRAKLLESISSVISSVSQELKIDSDYEFKHQFVKKLTSLKKTVDVSLKGRRDEFLKTSDDWLTSSELIFYFSRRFPGREVCIFRHVEDKFFLSKSLFDQSPSLSFDVDYISFHGLKRFLEDKTCIIFDTGSEDSQYGHFWPVKLDGNHSHVIDVMLNRLSKYLIEECHIHKWPIPGKPFLKCLYSSEFICVNGLNR
jgi:hypothetical protein